MTEKRNKYLIAGSVGGLVSLLMFIWILQFFHFGIAITSILSGLLGGWLIHKKQELFGVATSFFFGLSLSLVSVFLFLMGSLMLKMSF
jgi:LytS/YehU family sensor histidine kinase